MKKTVSFLCAAALMLLLFSACKLISPDKSAGRGSTVTAVPVETTAVTPVSASVSRLQPDALFEELLFDGYMAIGYYDVVYSGDLRAPFDVTISVSEVFEGCQAAVTYKSGNTVRTVYAAVRGGNLPFPLDQPTRCLLQIDRSAGVGGVWSEWSGLPSGITLTSDAAEITRQYRTRVKETTSRTVSGGSGEASDLTGWVLYSIEDAAYGAWGEWSPTRLMNPGAAEEQSQKQYRYRTRETISTTGSSVSSLDGWTLVDWTISYGDYGPWSGWSTDECYASDTREVESKLQYRYRDSWTEVYTYPVYADNYIWIAEETDNGSWSEWSEALPPSAPSVEWETRQEQVGIRYLMGHYCTGNVDGAQYMTAATNNTTNAAFNEHCEYHELGWYDSLSSFTVGNGGYIGVTCDNTCWTWYVMAEEPVYQDMYRYRSINTLYYYKVLGGWSDWSDYSPGGGSDVEIRTVYRYRDRGVSTTYYYERYGTWSAWSSTVPAASADREIEERTVYRYRSLTSGAVYHYYRWGDWSDWSMTKYTPDENREVETRLAYRTLVRTG